MQKEKLRFSIKSKMYIFMVVTILAIAMGTAGIAFRASADKIDRYYKEATAGNAKNYASMVDGDYVLKLRKYVESEEFQKIRDRAEEEENEEPVLDYLKEKGLFEEYDRIRGELTNYVNNIDGIEYLYLIAAGDADAKYDMYLIDDLSNPAYETGYYEERDRASGNGLFSRRGAHHIQRRLGMALLCILPGICFGRHICLCGRL